MFALGGNKDFALYRFTLLEVNPKAVEMKFLKLVAKGWSRSADCEVTNQSHQISHEVFLLFSSFELIIFERFMSFILVSFCLIDGWNNDYFNSKMIRKVPFDFFPGSIPVIVCYLFWWRLRDEVKQIQQWEQPNRSHQWLSIQMLPLLLLIESYLKIILNIK